MYDDIIDLVMDQQLLTEINTKTVNYKRLPIWEELHSKTDAEMEELQQSLSDQNMLTFDRVFREPIGFHFIKSYLESQHSVDKAIFIRDVETYQSLTDFHARNETAHKIYSTFCIPENPNRVKGTSALIKDSQAHLNATKHPAEVSYLSKSKSLPDRELSNFEGLDGTITQFELSKVNSELTELDTSRIDSHLSIDHNQDDPQCVRSTTMGSRSHYLQSNNSQLSFSEHLAPPMQSNSLHSKRDLESVSTVQTSNSNFFSDESNAIGIYGKCVVRLKRRMDADDFELSLFDEVRQQILNDLKLDVFPRFLKSSMFGMYLRCKSLEMKDIGMGGFHQMRTLGRGAFGSVNACKKKDTGRLYAMKQIDKKRVQATDSVRSLIAEKEFLSKMDSIFVTSLKYAFMDEERLYLIMDLMTGGDLKYHLNHDGIFEENRARFYSAQILLGIEHIHEKGIIYRDLKLENVLMDDRGHVKISDLGLAVSIEDGLVRGYAGTPGYTAPEVVLTQYYDQQVDFFSFGVVIYRSLCGKKPFAKKKSSEQRQKEMDRLRKTSVELDRNVIEMIPPFENPKYFTPTIRNLCRGLLNKNPKFRLGVNGFDEIKEHPWYDVIDWAQLDAGYLEAPFTPPMDEVHAEQQQYIGRPPDDDKYAKIKITDDFNESLREFAFKSNKVIQSELVDVLEKVHLDRRQSKNAEEFDVNQLYAFPTPEEVGGKRGCMSCVIV